MENFGRSIKRHVQLVTISNDCFLFSRQQLQLFIDQSFNLWENTKNPIKETYLTNDGGLTSFSRKKQKINYIQKFKSEFIDRKGRRYDNDFDFGGDFPERLYLEFVRLKNKEDLANSILFKNFCAFPSIEESEKLLKLYKKAGYKNSPIFVSGRGYKKCKKSTEQVQKVVNEIKKINIDFIWGKKEELEKNISKKDLPYNKIQWLNKELENTSTFLVNKKSYIWDKIINSGKDKRDLEKIAGSDNLKRKDVSLVKSYRVYGHFALCCLELYHDIYRSQGIFICEHCGKFFLPKSHADKQYCYDEQCEKSRLKHNKSIERVKNRS